MIISKLASRVSAVSAPGRSAELIPESAEPAASAAALVVVTSISCVLVVRPPAIGPAIDAYRPCTGLTPTSTLAAMPSGTPAIAQGTAANRSARTV
jgi:hypothetical protein